MSNSGLTIRDNLAWHGRRPGVKDKFKFGARAWAKAALHKLDRTTGLKALAAEVSELFTGIVAAQEAKTLARLGMWDDISIGLTHYNNDYWEDFFADDDYQFSALEPFEEKSMPEDEITWDDLSFKPVLGTHCAKNPGNRMAMQFVVSREDDGYEGYDAFGDA